ncbi:hypothetical protein MKX03_019774 [Papaver bracteatum]|nr:hypothetical protein MKX03_019774 [Papaver bracteatum]
MQLGGDRHCSKKGSSTKTNITTKWMSITVKTVKGSIFRIHAQPCETILSLKKNIEKSRGKDAYPYGQQLLIFKGKNMKDNTTLKENDVQKFDFIFLMLVKLKIHGTTVLGFNLTKSALLAADGRRTTDKCIVVGDRIKKAERLGKMIMIGTAGDGELCESMRRSFKSLVKILEKHNAPLSVEECTRRAHAVIRSVDQKYGYTSLEFSALVSGIEDNKPKLFVLRKSAYWEEENWYCVGSGRHYAAVVANQMTPSMPEALAVELAFRAIFVSAVHSFYSGGVVRVLVMSSSNGEIIFKEHVREMTELMDNYKFKFDQFSRIIQTTVVTGAESATKINQPSHLIQPTRAESKKKNKNNRKSKHERSGRKNYTGV